MLHQKESFQIGPPRETRTLNGIFTRQFLRLVCLPVPPAADLLSSFTGIPVACIGSELIERILVVNEGLEPSFLVNRTSVLPLDESTIIKESTKHIEESDTK